MPEAVEGETVTIDGFVFPLDTGAPRQHFLLAAYRAHCPFCMPGGLRSIVEVLAAEPFDALGGIVRARGRLGLAKDSFGLASYRLDGAQEMTLEELRLDSD